MLNDFFRLQFDTRQQDQEKDPRACDMSQRFAGSDMLYNWNICANQADQRRQ